MNETIIIKKYNNRKLYNTSEGKYITLKGIRDLIKLGYKVKVIENSTGVNITQVVLLQAYVASLNPSDFSYVELYGRVLNSKR